MKLTKTYDVAVIGGGPGGIAAAISAARNGASVILAERNGYLGGQLGSGLPFLAFLDRKQRQVIGGVAQEFVDRLSKLNGTHGHTYCPFHISTTVIHPFLARIICFEMAKETGIDLLMHCELSDVKVSGGKIKSVTLSGKGEHIEIEANIFIDATGDGDLGFAAGASFNKGQEKDNVLQPPTLMFNLGGVDFEAFCDFIAEHPEELPYGLKMNNLREGYNAEFFRNNPSFIFFGMQNLIKKLRKEGKCPVARDTVIFIRQPIPGEVAVNTIRILNFDGSSVADLSRGELEAHLQILPLIDMFRDFVPGFKNCYLTSINSSIGVRESRRILGHKILSHKDCLDGIVSEDSIALCSYFIDIHSGTSDDTTGITVEEPFGIPYLCLVSKDVDNLMMSGRCISVDPIAFGATRIMNVCMAVGQACGTAASMATSCALSPKEVDVEKLRIKIAEQGAILKV
ncbi:FAD-dependent oxidoreductase [Treponema parvum]|uniref:FAD-dependent oxidoreductase n=1 Tax=Treponema parvum TaxID=138851 RepID=A0A975F5Q9_9SPIR|nr:FAD-dependent oxidoreductase [Treponema parvum]QTQ14469.1 FAD-dependent oxidoreductase [Treponema parvum]